MKKLLFVLGLVLLIGCGGPDNPIAGQWVILDTDYTPNDRIVKVEGILYISDVLVDKGEDGYTTKLWMDDYGGFLWFNNADDIDAMKGYMYMEERGKLIKIDMDFNSTNVNDSLELMVGMMGMNRKRIVKELGKFISEIKDNSLLMKKYRMDDEEINEFEIVLNKDTLALDKLDLYKSKKKNYRGAMGVFNTK